MRTDGEQIVLPPRGADQPRRRVLLFGHKPAVLADLHVAADLPTAIVPRGAVRVEADEPRQPAGAAIHLVHDLFVVDPLEELPREVDARRRAALPDLIEKAVRDEL